MISGSSFFMVFFRTKICEKIEPFIPSVTYILNLICFHCSLTDILVGFRHWKGVIPLSIFLANLGCHPCHFVATESLMCLLNFVFFWHFPEDGKEATNSEAPENNPQYTTVYVGNLAPEVMKCSFFTYVSGSCSWLLQKAKLSSTSLQAMSCSLKIAKLLESKWHWSKNMFPPSLDVQVPSLNPDSRIIVSIFILMNKENFFFLGVCIYILWCQGKHAKTLSSFIKNKQLKADNFL